MALPAWYRRILPVTGAFLRTIHHRPAGCHGFCFEHTHNRRHHRRQRPGGGDHRDQQSSGVSLLSAPTITTQSGLKANIDIVREFPYPTSFEKPKLSTGSNLAYSSPPSAANTPLVLAIPHPPGVCDRGRRRQSRGQAHHLSRPTHRSRYHQSASMDFDGFINYGVPIRTRWRNRIPIPYRKERSSQPASLISPSSTSAPW